MAQTETKRLLTLRVGYDQYVECPIGESGDAREKIAVFKRSHVHYVDPDTYIDDNGRMKIGLRRQLETGTAFLLDCYEHSGVVWSLSGEGTPCRFDTARCAGIYFGPSDVPKDMRREYARQTIQAYNDWCNGECYYASLTDRTPGEPCATCGHVEAGDDPLDSCGGFVGAEALREYVIETLRHFAKEPVRLQIEGDCAFLIETADLPETCEKV